MSLAYSSFRCIGYIGSSLECKRSVKRFDTSTGQANVGEHAVVHDCRGHVPLCSWVVIESSYRGSNMGKRGCARISEGANSATIET
jgi:hypothetical protein